MKGYEVKSLLKQAMKEIWAKTSPNFIDKFAGVASPTIILFLVCYGNATSIEDSKIYIIQSIVAIAVLLAYFGVYCFRTVKLYKEIRANINKHRNKVGYHYLFDLESDVDKLVDLKFFGNYWRLSLFNARTKKTDESELFQIDDKNKILVKLKSGNILVLSCDENSITISSYLCEDYKCLYHYGSIHITPDEKPLEIIKERTKPEQRAVMEDLECHEGSNKNGDRCYFFEIPDEISSTEKDKLVQFCNVMYDGQKTREKAKHQQTQRKGGDKIEQN